MIQLEPKSLFDDAIIGTTEGPMVSDEEVYAYDKQKVINILMKQHNWGEEDAIEWYEYNILNLCGMVFITKKENDS